MEKEIKKEELRKEEKVEEVKEVKVEENVIQNEIINENVIEEKNEEKPSYRKLKSFTLYEKKTNSGATYYSLEVKTFGDKTAEIRLSEGQGEAVKEVGASKCYVDIESRYSDKARKYYDVIALHIDDVATFDLFARDRGFVTIARLHAKKYFGD